MLCREHNHIAQDTAFAVAPHTSSNSHSHITTEFGYKHTFCQNVVPTKYCFSLYFRKNVTCLSVGLLMAGQVFTVCCKTVYRCVTTYCCCMRDISQSAACLGPMWAIIRKNHSYKRWIWHWCVSSCVHRKYTIKIRYMKSVFKLGVRSCDIKTKFAFQRLLHSLQSSGQNTSPCCLCRERVLCKLMRKQKYILHVFSPF
jgi:hypothetical protein